jgi:hypothetical protein
MSDSFGHGGNSGASRRDKIARFPLTHALPDGHDLPDAERQAWREQVAAMVLANELAGSSTFWKQVEVIRAAPGDEGELVDQIAGRYGRGRTRQVIRVLLETAAEAPDDESARMALLGCGVRAVWTRPNAAGRRSRYPAAKSYAARLHAGARALARRGAGECMSCGQPSATGSTYCQRHDGDTWGNKKLERDLRRALECAAPAILHGGVVPEDQRNQGYRKLGYAPGEGGVRSTAVQRR